MTVMHEANDLLAQEARALLTRLARLSPFVLSEPMVPAAALAPDALRSIETYLAAGRASLHSEVLEYMAWIGSEQGQAVNPSVAQRRLTLLRLRFNAALSQFDIFADALTQRSETTTGVWLSGLDVAATDLLSLAGGFYDAPPVICYLDRGPGAAIRRARTRLPGGGDNPVAILRIPRERMIGSGIGSSLAHEVGHQAAALLNLVPSARMALRSMQPRSAVWKLWDRWISEIAADLWAVGKVGIAGVLGLIAVVSLPRAFVMAIRRDDPHPPPWIRVKLACAFGDELFPHQQWAQLANIWDSLYSAPEAGILRELEAAIPALAALLVDHRPSALLGHSLREVLASAERTPDALAGLFARCRGQPERLRGLPPALALATVAQARADGRLTPEQESGFMSYLLTQWAMRKSLEGN